MGVLEKKVCFHRDISPCKMEYYAKGGRDMAEQPLSPEEGFASILERYEKMVYGFALARTGSRAACGRRVSGGISGLFPVRKTFPGGGAPQGLAPAHHPQFQPPVTASPWRRRVVPLSERADAPVQFQTPEQTGSGPPSPLCQTAEGPPLPVLL